MHILSKHSRHARKYVAYEVESDSSTLVKPIDENTHQWDGSTQNLYGIAHGSAGMVWAVNKYTVVKVYLGRDSRSIGNSDTERQAYQNLIGSGLAPDHFLKCYDVNNKYGLLLERCRETVRQRVKSADYSAHSEALSLAIQAAQGLEVIHCCGIVQGDVGCHNMLIGYDEKLKIADFAGSCVEGAKYPSLVDYEVGSKLPGSSEPTERSDIFALGSAIYEMITRRQPYKGLHYTEIQRRFQKGIFPDDFEECYKLGPIIEKCWGKRGRSFHTAAQVLEALYELDPPSRIPHILQRAAKKSIQQTRAATQQTSISREPPLEPPRDQARNSHSENTKYVCSHRSEKRGVKSRRSARSQWDNILIDNNVRKKHRTCEHGALNSIVHIVQGLKLSVHSRSLSSKGKDHY